ncbi:MAG: hypothetical protein Q8S13_06525, partial [Dehalococcoidia bacterium]|nr:hypothetical protein [Dehalococcoidia bacterium]
RFIATTPAAPGDSYLAQNGARYLSGSANSVQVTSATKAWYTIDVPVQATPSGGAQSNTSDLMPVTIWYRNALGLTTYAVPNGFELSYNMLRPLGVAADTVELVLGRAARVSFADGASNGVLAQFLRNTFAVDGRNGSNGIVRLWETAAWTVTESVLVVGHQIDQLEVTDLSISEVDVTTLST